MKKNPTKRKKRRLSEWIIEKLLFVAAAVSVFTTLAILGVFLLEATGFFGEVSIVEFFTGTQWTPLFKDQHFGVLPLIWGTIMVTVIAISVAIPIGLGSAIFLSEYAPKKMRQTVKPVLEILAGIPTVVYGYFALTFVSPLLQIIFPEMIVFNALSAGLVMGIMIIPMVASLSEDAMMAVPQSFRDGAYALGAHKHEVALGIVIPSALSGIVASFILAISRAVGETMIVSIAAGSTPKLTLNPLESIQTMTAYISQISLGEAPFGSLEYKTIFSVGLTLFLMTLVINLIGQWIAKRYWRRY
ncbi:MAG TPA: phosphate ABC transporter permease subunit PstC [Candidatus Glassbacteria bacterium]|nr:phosphate ABC transporter permease subunit PstC [Candidatus Glassbacteria bacterium]